MKLKIGYYNVEVTATEDVFGEDKTREFINQLSVAFDHAAAYFKENDMPANYQHFKRMGTETFDFLDENGYYD